MSQEPVSSAFVIQNALLASKLARKVGNRLTLHGVSLTEYLVMRYLFESAQKAVPRTELAEHVGMSASGISRLIAPMEKNRIIEKLANPRDARQSLVKLSKTGQRLFSEARMSFDDVAREAVGGLSDVQQAKIVELYGKVL